jgi:hypothetical protein
MFSPVLPASAQQRPQDDQQANISPEERAAQSLRSELQVSDDEWAILQPRIQRIADLKQALMSVTGSAMANATGQRYRGRSGTVSSAASDYRQSLDDVRRTLLSTPATEAVRRSIEAARRARTAAEQEITSAQQDLVPLLTTQQEAILVQYGILD